MGIWLVLGLEWGFVFEPLEHLGDIAGHQEMHFSIHIIPFQGNSKVPCPSMINRDFIILPDAVEQMLFVFLPHVLHAKVVYAQCEGDWAPFVKPKTQCV